MPKQHVITRLYSQYWDPKTDLQFEPVVDVQTNTRVGHVFTDIDYSERYGFEVLTDDEYKELIAGRPQGEPAEPDTGDPVADAAKAADQAKTDAKTDTKAQAQTGDPVADAAKAAK